MSTRFVEKSELEAPKSKLVGFAMIHVAVLRAALTNCHKILDDPKAEHFVKHMVLHQLNQDPTFYYTSNLDNDLS
jgi:hypothetical protein